MSHSEKDDKIQLKKFILQNRNEKEEIYEKLLQGNIRSLAELAATEIKELQDMLLQK